MRHYATLVARIANVVTDVMHESGIVGSRDLHYECSTFLAREAELLDDNLLRQWLDCLHRDIQYEMPIRVTRERPVGPGFSSKGWHMREDWHSLKTRVARLETKYAWAEDPPSRTRRFITNVRISDFQEAGVPVKSNLLLFRGRYDAASYDFIAAERHDLLVSEGNGWKLRRRTILLDHTTLGVSNLAVFL